MIMGQLELKQIEEILKDLKKIKYGSIEIIVHNGQIIQIERKEKIRIEKAQSRQTA
jgi:hypothetical protein